MTLTNPTVQGNHAYSDSGGIYSNGRVTLAGTSTLTSNHGGQGGGAFVNGYFTLSGPDASIHNNTASSGGGGGGIYSYSLNHLTNCTAGVNVYNNTPNDIVQS